MRCRAALRRSYGLLLVVLLVGADTASAAQEWTRSRSLAGAWEGQQSATDPDVVRLFVLSAGSYRPHDPEQRGSRRVRLQVACAPGAVTEVVAGPFVYRSRSASQNAFERTAAGRELPVLAFPAEWSLRLQVDDGEREAVQFEFNEYQAALGLTDADRLLLSWIDATTLRLDLASRSGGDARGHVEFVLTGLADSIRLLDDPCDWVE